jgi:hypothetical protein
MKACVAVASSQWSAPHPAQVATQWLPLARGGFRGVLQAMQWSIGMAGLGAERVERFYAARGMCRFDDAGTALPCAERAMAAPLTA